MLSSLLTIYKSLVRPHLDYADVIYEQPNPGCYEAIIIQVVTELCFVEQIYYEFERNSAKNAPYVIRL